MTNIPIGLVEISKDSFLLVELDERLDLDVRGIDKRIAIHTNEAGKNLPAGSENVSATERIGEASELLYRQIEGLGVLARQTVEKTRPHEVVIETYVKFAGDVKVIPFIVGTSGEGGLKLILTWKRETV